MSTVNLEDAKDRLGEIITALTPGEQLLIVERGQPIATLTRASARQWPCKAGSAKDRKHWISPDFDAPLDDFREYM
jgi:antitoxin (DNA-binding transcriptional repressor) of toxin-antitoxin stability system